MRRLAEGLSISLASMIATAAFVELGISHFHPVPHSIERNMYFEPSPFTGYRNRPNSIGFFQDGIPAHVNTNGHRDDLVTVAKPEGVFRILVLGDSFSVGANVHQEEAYPQVLERILAQECSQRIEVINSSVGGWGPFQYAQYFDYEGVRYLPDLVLVGFFVGNDAHDEAQRPSQLPTAVHGRRISKSAARSQTAGVRVWLTEHFHLARLAFAKAPAAFPMRRTSCSIFPPKYLEIQRQRLGVHRADPDLQSQRSANSIAQVQRLPSIGLRETRYVVALLPDETQVNPALQERLIRPKQRAKFDLRMPQRHLVREFLGAGMPTIDLLDAFLRDDRCLYMNDTHWSAEGHELAATVIATALAPMLPCDRDRLGTSPESPKRL